MNTPSRSRQGFTLVELLVVIVIIGILAGLITGAAIMARIAAKKAVVKMDIEQLSMALEKYKNEVGEYPPDFTMLLFQHSDATIQQTVREAAQNDVLRHLRKRFPRYVPVGDISKTSTTDTPWKRFCYDVYHTYDQFAGGNLNPNNFDPASSLLFFLGGLPEQNGGEWVPAGFHADPTRPFQPGQPRSEPFFTFARERVRVTDTHTTAPATRYLRYYPPNIEAPYVYFKSRHNEYINALVGVDLLAYYHTSTDVCTPYLEPLTNPAAPEDWKPSTLASQRLWRSPGKFQIVTAGLDGEFGRGKYFRYTRVGLQIDPANNTQDPTPPLDAGNFDNLTNFAEGTLEDEM